MEQLRLVIADDCEAAGIKCVADERGHGTIRILVADDFIPWRRFVSSLLQKVSGWHVVCEVSDGLEAVQKATELTPDLVLLGIGLPKLNGIEAARQIRKLVPNSKILFVSRYDSVDFVEAALSTGADGYVFKADAGGELVRAVEAVFQNKRFLSSRPFYLFGSQPAKKAVVELLHPSGDDIEREDPTVTPDSTTSSEE